MSLDKINFCLRALKDRGLVKWGNFSQNPNKLQHVSLLIPNGITQKLQLTVHFLQLKERKFEDLRNEIACLRAELGENNTVPDADQPCRSKALSLKILLPMIF